MELETILSGDNLVDHLDDKELTRIGLDALNGFDRDKDSRQQWEERNAEALKLALQVREQKSFPWPGASNVHYPLVTVACMQFNARAYPSLVPNSNIVKHRVIGRDADGKKTARARRVSEHMNWQLTSQDESWEDEMDRLLMTEPLLGCSFKKSYFCPEEGRNVSEHVTPDNFVVDYYTRSLDSARRKTHVLYYYKNEIIEKMRMDLWKEYELNPSQVERTEMQIASDDAQGNEPPVDNRDAHYQVIEQHCYLDLDEDGYDEPYIVTVMYDTGEVLRIVPRFQPENVMFSQNGEIAKIKADEYFTKFGFIPSPDGSFYDIGFGILLSPMNESVNTIINQLIDAGTLSNLQSGYISKALRVKNGKSEFTPGEWKQVNAYGDDIRKGLVPLPVREPSQTLFALLGTLIEAGQKIGSVSEMMVGESPGQNQPATTTMAVLEQGLKVYSSIIKRNHRALTEEFRKLYALNALYLDPEEYFEVLDPQMAPSPQEMQAMQQQQAQQQGMQQGMQPEGMPIGAQPQGMPQEPDRGVVYQEDYFGDPKDIAPASDPNIVSDAQRLAKAETVLARATARPDMYDAMEAERRYLEAIQETGIDTLLVPQQLPPDPEITLKQQQFEDESERAWTKLELDAQETVVNMRKRQAETEGRAVDTEVKQEKMDLETAKFVVEAEQSRAELIAKTLTERNKMRKENANESGTS